MKNLEGNIENIVDELKLGSYEFTVIKELKEIVEKTFDEPDMSFFDAMRRSEKELISNDLLKDIEFSGTWMGPNHRLYAKDDHHVYSCYKFSKDKKVYCIIIWKQKGYMI